ncbi:MAG: O-methyltransferase [Cytophagales bacterium]|nr:O-methyltransferase [Cytophagales bacterium]
MDFLSQDLNSYVQRHTGSASELLNRIERETHLHVLMPRMISGHLQGRVLSMLMKMIQPKFILEIGTYTGYSALCMAEGLAANGKLVTIDKNEELEDRVKGYFEASAYQSQIDFLVGNAMEIVPTLDQPWDVVFLDADKTNYLNYYQMVFDQVQPGGYIIADNVLWSGKVLDEKVLDEDTEALKLFNKEVQADSRVENVLFPLRDGIMIVRKC